jgi:hypothetical protein
MCICIYNKQIITVSNVSATLQLEMVKVFQFDSILFLFFFLLLFIYISNALKFYNKTNK